MTEKKAGTAGTPADVTWVGPNNQAEVAEVRAPELLLQRPAYGRFNQSARALLQEAADKAGQPSFAVALITGAHNKGLLMKAVSPGTDNATPLHLHRAAMMVNLAIQCKYFKLPMGTAGTNLAVPVALDNDPTHGWCITLDFTAARERTIRRNYDRKARSIGRNRAKAEKELHQADVAAAMLDLQKGKKI